MTTIDSIKAWLGQSTTGQGFAGLATIIAGVASHAITWQDAAVAAVPTLILIVWPQRAVAAAAAGPVVRDLESLVGSYRLGLQHGSAAQAAIQAMPAAAPLMTDAGKLAAALAATPSASVTVTAVSPPVPAVA